MCSLYLSVSVNLDASVSLVRRKALSKMNLHLGLPRSKERLGCKISEASSFFGCELRVARELLTPSDMYHTIAWPLHVCGLKSCSGSPHHTHTYVKPPMSMLFVGAVSLASVLWMSVALPLPLPSLLVVGVALDAWC